MNLIRSLEKAYRKRQTSFLIPSSKSKKYLCAYLLRCGFIKKFSILKRPNNSFLLLIEISKIKSNFHFSGKNFKNSIPFLSFVKISSTTRKITLNYKDIGDMLDFNKIFLISTSKGFLTGSECVFKKIGGIYVGYFEI